MTRTLGATSRASVLAVVAHPDDDLLFLNPDLDTGIRAGLRTTVVYVTAGQAESTGAEAAARARARQRGVQDAYRVSGRVADRPLQDEWARQVVTVADRDVEEYRLRDRPDVRLVFLGLPDGALAALATGAVLQTWPAADGAVTAVQPYDADTLLAVLAGLIARYAATHLHVTELVADPRYDVPASHPDHRAAAAFAERAVAQHRAATGGSLPHLTEHRDYGIGQHPVDLDPVTRARKRRLFADEYQPWDPAASDLHGWTDRAYYRHPAGTRWSAVDSDGTLHLFTVRAGRAVSWHGDATTWTGPVEIGEGFTTVTPLRRLDGGIELAARTADHRVLVRQLDGDWTDLGTHDPGDTARHFGTPVLASNADGRLQVFAVNAGGGLSTRWETTEGGWADWLDLGGSDLQDPCDALLDAAGRIDVVAATRTELWSWRQTSPNAGFTRRPVPARPPASPPTIAVNADGRLEVHHREAGTATVAVSWQDAGLAWGASTAVTGVGGIGPPATATWSSGRIATVVRNSAGGVSVAVQAAPNTGYGRWTDLGGQVVEYPTVVATRDGRVVVAAVHVDGVLRSRTRSSRGVWTPWATVGGMRTVSH